MDGKYLTAMHGCAVASKACWSLAVLCHRNNQVACSTTVFELCSGTLFVNALAQVSCPARSLLTLVAACLASNQAESCRYSATGQNGFSQGQMGSAPGAQSVSAWGLNQKSRRYRPLLTVLCNLWCSRTDECGCVLSTHQLCQQIHTMQ